MTPASPAVVLSASDSTDPLALFESEVTADSAATPEAPAPSPAPAPPAAAPAHGIALDTVVNRLRHVAWAEAVAIVDALCVSLRDRSAKAGVPELPDISITDAGTVATRAGAAMAAPGPSLARTLHALTASGSVPVPLRLFITKWIAFEDPHSIQDFAGELAYYTRPDGAVLIRGVYERAVAAPAVAAPASSPQVETPTPASRVPTVPRRRPRVRGLVVAVAVALCGATAAAVWVWRGETAPVERPLSLLASLVQRVGLTAPAVRPGGSDVPVEGTSSSGDSPAANRARPAAQRGTLPGLSAQRLSDNATGIAAMPALETASSTAGAGAAVGPAPLVIRGVEETDGGVDAVAPVASARIFSSADVDVTPPTMRQAQLPTPLLANARSEVNTMELIVSETGAVERVRLLSVPRRMADMMMLSGAKAWTFEPASWRGQPVKYRLLMSWHPTP